MRQRRRRAALNAEDIHKEPRQVAHRHSIHNTEQQFKSLFSELGDGTEHLDNPGATLQKSPPRRHLASSTVLTPQKKEDITNKILSRVPSTPDISARDEFFERFQVLGRQRQIASVTAHDDAGVIAPLVNPSHASTGAFRHSSRRLRSRTLPENLSESSSAANLSTKRDIDDTFLTRPDTSSAHHPHPPLLSPFQSPPLKKSILSPFQSPHAKKARREVKRETPQNTTADTPTLHHSPVKSMVLGTSPRSIYINGCMREGLNPRASLVLRKKVSKKLSLQHQVKCYVRLYQPLFTSLRVIILYCREWVIKWGDYLPNL